MQQAFRRHRPDLGRREAVNIPDNLTVVKCHRGKMRTDQSTNKIRMASEAHIPTTTYAYAVLTTARIREIATFMLSSASFSAYNSAGAKEKPAK